MRLPDSGRSPNATCADMVAEIRRLRARLVQVCAERDAMRETLEDIKGNACPDCHSSDSAGAVLARLERDPLRCHRHPDTRLPCPHCD